MLDHSGSSFALTNQLSHFGVTQPFNKPQHDQLLMFGIEFLESGTYFFCFELAFNRHEDVGARLLGFNNVLDRHTRMPSSIMIDDQIVGQTIEPGGERGSARFVAVDSLPCLEEDMFAKILRFAFRPDSVIDISVNPFEVRFVEAAKSRCIALDGTRNQASLIVGWHL